MKRKRLAVLLLAVARAAGAEPFEAPRESGAAPPTSASASPAPAPAPAPAAAPLGVISTRDTAARAPSPASSATPPPLVPRIVSSPGQAEVHVAVNRRDAWLEMRSYVDGGDFVRVCRAPCDLTLQVEDREARVVAPGMTTSNVFRFDAGSGTAGVRVEGGSSSLRTAGVISLAAGIPIALAGMAMFALGRVHHSSGMEAAGIAGLSLGGVGVGISLPLVVLGTTRVKNAKGSLIAVGEPSRARPLF